MSSRRIDWQKVKVLVAEREGLEAAALVANEKYAEQLAKTEDLRKEAQALNQAYHEKGWKICTEILGQPESDHIPGPIVNYLPPTSRR